MKVIKIAIYIMFVILFSQCHLSMEDTMYSWYCDNKTDHYLGIYIAFGIYDFSQTAYPDTTLPTVMNGIFGADPYKKQLVWESHDREKLVNSLPADTLSVFIFHVDTLQKYSWEIVRRDYKILKRYDLSLQNLKQLNFTIPYPPTSDMKNMKMYPPYNE